MRAKGPRKLICYLSSVVRSDGRLSYFLVRLKCCASPKNVALRRAAEQPPASVPENHPTLVNTLARRGERSTKMTNSPALAAAALTRRDCESCVSVALSRPRTGIGRGPRSDPTHDQRAAGKRWQCEHRKKETAALRQFRRPPRGTLARPFRAPSVLGTRSDARDGR